MGSTVTGPITGGTHGWAFGAATIDLTAEGYVEEEYFLEGDATRYRPIGELGTDGRWAVEANGSAPFRTRLLVRRPVDAARFNGTVIVEWNNVSAGTEIFEAGDTHVVFDEGFAYVGVSAQRVGVHGFAVKPHGLVAWDPERYGTLEIVDDGSHGIFSEAGAVGPEGGGAVDPLGGLPVERLIALGGSQSASKLATYINAVQPVESVFDAFVAFTWFGSGSGVDSTAVMDPSDPDARSAIMAHPRHPRRPRRAGDGCQLRARSDRVLRGSPARHRSLPVLGGGGLTPRTAPDHAEHRREEPARRDPRPCRHRPGGAQPGALDAGDGRGGEPRAAVDDRGNTAAVAAAHRAGREPAAVAMPTATRSVVRASLRWPRRSHATSRRWRRPVPLGLMGQWFPFEPEVVRRSIPTAAHLAAHDAAASGGRRRHPPPHDADAGRARREPRSRHRRTRDADVA